jgi:uncharacterized repeat protein (TIGR01451 family)
VKQLNTFKDYLLFIFGLMTFATGLSPAFAQTTQPNTLTIERVWTRDGNGNDKTTFVPNDAIQYVTLISNTYSQPVKMKIRFEAAGPTWLGGAGNPAYRSIALYEQQDVDVPVGLSGYYTPSTIPASAQPGEYGVGIFICWGETGGGSPGSSCTGTSTVNSGSFNIPGTLATDITTFLPDGITPTSAAGATVGPGSALVYKITITNTSSADNTGVVLTDTLPPELFDLISDGTAEIFTDHGTCEKVGSWGTMPPTTVICQLGNLGAHETATISYMASILVRDPSGEPQPPESFVHTVHVKSDQQDLTSASVKTLVTAEELTDAEALAFLDAAAGCVTLVPIIGPLAGWVWEMLGRDLATGQPSPYIEKLVQAADLGSKDMLVWTLKKGGYQVGLPEKVFPLAADSAGCVAGFRSFLGR